MDNTHKNQNIDLEEQQWFEYIYQGDKISELTLKVLIAGASIGLLLISSNIYLGLKTGLTQCGSAGSPGLYMPVTWRNRPDRERER